MKVLITILDSITETSMPFNEFVMYRARHVFDERQVLIVCNKNRTELDHSASTYVTIERVGWNIFKLRSAILKYIRECELSGYEYCFHLHQNKSAVLSILSTFFTPFRKKLIFTTHNTFSGFPLHNKIQSFICGFFSNYVVCCSISAFSGYPRLLKKIKGAHALPIQNGVDTERIDNLLEVFDVAAKTTVDFVYVARMVPVKNHKFLIDVIKRCDKRAHFIFVGALDKQIQTKFIKEGLGHKITFMGLIDRNQVFKVLQKSDVYISPSLLEGLPVSVLEAMYVGLPSILSNIPQHQEICHNNEFVTLLPLETEKWIDAINNYVNKITTCGTNKLPIRIYIKENFSLERMHKQYGLIYDLLRNK